MTRKSNIAKLPAVVDPSLPFSEIGIDGKIYKMVFKYSALAAAEAKLIGMGYKVSLLLPMVRKDTLFGIRVLFAVSLYAYHPELDPEQTQEWVNDDNILDIFQAIDDAWKKSMPAGRPGNPPKPDQ